MNRILKYEIVDFGLTGISLPPAAKVLCAQVQRGLIQLWVEVNSNFAGHEKNRWFTVRATGAPYQPQGDEKYVDTVQLSNGQLVFHVFEVFPQS